MIFSIAWRNVWRNKLRSLVIILAVFFGLVGGIFSVALMNGMMQQMINSSIETQLSNIQVHDSSYLINNEVKFAIQDADKLYPEIKNTNNVRAVSKRIKAQAMASTAATGTGVMIIGINPEMEEKVTTIYDKITKGTYFDTKSKSQPIVIGEKLAHKLNAKIGNKIVITIQNLDNVITYGAFRVVGIFETHNSNFDESNVFVKFDDLAKLIDFNSQSATEFLIRLDDNKKTDEVAVALKEKLPKKLKVQTWMQIRPEFELFNTWMSQMLYLFLVIILLGLAFGIVNAMLMAVMERVKEIGMLMAVGMNKRKIFSMIMLETIFLSLTGGILGILASYGIVQYFAVAGIDLSIVSEGLSAVGYASIAYPSISNSYYFVVAIMVIITAVIASIYPARKALKFKPAEAIREDA